MKRIIKDVDAYIASAPAGVRGKLQEMRNVLREIAPHASEGISYGMPGYDNGKIAWFGFQKKHIGLYLRPPIIGELKDALTGYKTTKSAIHFPLDKKLPIPLIQRLIMARIKKNKDSASIGIS